jgi:hypothetical protein
MGQNVVDDEFSGTFQMLVKWGLLWNFIPDCAQEGGRS